MTGRLLMGCLCTCVGLWAFLLGMWDHDWRLIVAGLAVSIVWPMVTDGLKDPPAPDPDPYSTCIVRVRRSLSEALYTDGAISEAERANLIAIEETVRERDNY